MKKAAEATPNQLLMQARKEQRWSQEEVADKLNTGPNTISRWENGVTVPRAYHRDALCKLFEKSEAELGFSDAHKTPLVGASAPLSLLDPLIPSLPSGIVTLVGRHKELADLKFHLSQYSDSKPHFLALYGTPGVGKTALLTALVHDLARHEPTFDGILWGGVGPEPSLLNVLSRWGTLLNVASMGTKVEELHSHKDWIDALKMAIGLRRMLIVIDDVWSIGDALKLSIGGPNCTHILTTRHAEIAIGYAGNDATMIHELDTQCSIEMLQQLIPNVVAHELDAVQTLVDEVGGLPLALLIMGKYLQVEASRGQQRRLHNALQKLHEPTWRLPLNPLLSGNDTSLLVYDIPRSVQNAIALSVQQLDEHAQYSLRVLSVFPPKPNTFSEEAALAVTNSTASVLDTLADASLLEVAADTERYTLHQTIADYGKLQHHPDADIAKRRLASYFVSYIERHQTSYPDLAKEMENILCAMQIAHEQAMTEVLVRGISLLTPFLLSRGLYDTAQLYLEHGRHMAEQSGDEHLLALILLSMGQVAERQGELQQSSSLYEKGLAIARHQKDRTLTRDFLASLGEVTLNRGNHEQAELYIREGLQFSSENEAQRCKLLKTLGEAVDYRGDFSQADSLYKEALVIAQAIDDNEMVVTLLQNMGAKAFKEGQYKQANSHFREGLLLAREIGHRHRESALLTNMGMVAIKQEKYVQAEKYCSRGLNIAQSINNAVRMINALQNLGILEGMRDNGNLAEQYLQKSVDLASKIEHQWLINEGLCALGEVYLKQHKHDEARDTFDTALTLAQTKGFQELLALALFGQACLAKEQQDYVQARELARKSLELLHAEGHYKATEVTAWLKTLPPSL